MEDTSCGDFEQELLRDGEPVSRGDASSGIEPELLAQPTGELVHLDVMRDGNGVPALACRPTSKLVRELSLDGIPHR